jgi:hypothetical protein
MMKTVWVICETVDLGYHMVKGYDSYDKANAEFERLCEEAKAEQIGWLVKGGQTQEQAEVWVNRYESGRYELNSLEVEE